MKFGMNPGPYIRRKRTTFQIMMELGIALLLVWFAAIAYNFTVSSKDGISAIINVVISVGVIVVVEALWYLKGVLKDPKITNKFQGLVHKVLHSYGYITGIILALILPVNCPIYVTIITAIFSIVVGKLIFGGFGHNIFNPAVLGRVFAQLFIADLQSTDPSVVTTPTITSFFNSNGWGTSLQDQNLSLLNLLIGNRPAALGEAFTLLIIILGVVLTIRKVIDCRISLAYVGTLFIASLFMGLASGYGLKSFEFALIQILVGGVIFGAVFCLTDPVTSPTSQAGRLTFAIGSALVTFIIRYQCSAAEGVAYSILMMNMLTPLIDKMNKGTTFDKKLSRIAILVMLLGATSTLGVCYSSSVAQKPTIETNVTKIDNGTYTVVGDPSADTRFGKVSMRIYVNPNQKKVTNIIIDFDNSSCTEGYGKSLLSGTKDKEFFDTYVDTSRQAITFSTFRKANPMSYNSAVVDGVMTAPTTSETALTYLRSVNAVLDEVENVKYGASLPFQVALGIVGGASIVAPICYLVVAKVQDKRKKGGK